MNQQLQIYFYTNSFSNLNIVTKNQCCLRFYDGPISRCRINLEIPEIIHSTFYWWHTHSKNKILLLRFHQRYLHLGSTPPHKYWQTLVKYLKVFI